MNSRNDLLFVSIHGAFLTFDPLSCTSQTEGAGSNATADAGSSTSRTSDKTSRTGFGGLVWNRRRKRPIVLRLT